METALGLFRLARGGRFVSTAAAPSADAGGVAALGVAPFGYSYGLYPLIHVSGYDQKCILTCQVSHHPPLLLASSLKLK